MENQKKDYLFRIGPLLFLPKQKQSKIPAYKDSSEQYRNLLRLAVIVLWGMVTIGLIEDCVQGEPFGDISKWPSRHYLVMVTPLFVSLIDLYLVWTEKRTGIPMNKYSKVLIYGSWIVSAVYYSTFIYNYFIL